MLGSSQKTQLQDSEITNIFSQSHKGTEILMRPRFVWIFAPLCDICARTPPQLPQDAFYFASVFAAGQVLGVIKAAMTNPANVQPTTLSITKAIV